MSASTTTTAAYLFKKVYSGDEPGDLAVRDHHLLKMMRKVGDFYGDGFKYAIQTGNPQGVSGAFATAQTNAKSSKGKQPEAALKTKYGVITLDGVAMAKASNNAGAFMDLVTMETDGVLEEMGDTLAFDLFRDGNGVRGRRSSAATNVITLTVADDARNFKEGMTVIADNDITGASPRSGTTTVASINEDAGTVTLTSAAGITSFADNDYLFREGDPATCMEGFSDQFPLTAPSSGESWRGIDRSTNTNRLAGVRVDDTATSIEENAGLVAVKISQIGQKADCLWLNPIKFWEVSRRLNAKVEYSDAGGKADYGFEYISIHSPAGTLKCYADADCPTNRGYVTNMSTLYIKHLYGVPHLITDDGRPNLRESGADGIEARMRSLSNLICTRPGANGVFSI